MRASRQTAVLMLLLMLCAYPRAQDKRRPQVTWGPQPACDKSSKPEAALAGPKCSQAEAEQMTFRIVDLRGVTYAMTYRLSRNFVVASIQLTNNSGTPVEINPLRSKLLRYNSEQEFRTDARPADTESSLPPDKLRQVTVLPEVVGEPEGGIRPGLSVNVIYEDRITRTGRTRGSPRLEPKETVDQPMMSSTKAEVMVPRGVFDFLLRSKTVADKEKTAGHIVFRNGGQSGYFVFMMNAGTFDVLIPVGEIGTVGAANPR